MHLASYRCMMLILVKCFVSSEKHLINIRSWRFLSSNSLNIDVTLFYKLYAVNEVTIGHTSCIVKGEVHKQGPCELHPSWVGGLYFCYPRVQPGQQHTSKECNKFCFQNAFAMRFTFANLKELKGVPLVYLLTTFMTLSISFHRPVLSSLVHG